MSENDAANSAANANADFGRDQRRANTPEGRRPVEARDRAPEVYVEGEQVARLVENRSASVDTPAVSWFADDVEPGDSPAAVLTAARPDVKEAAPAVENGAPGGAPPPATGAGPGRTSADMGNSPGDARPLDEFDIVLRGLDRADSPLNSAFPRLGVEDRSIFDPEAFSGITPPTDGGMMRPAVEPRTEDTTVDLSGGGDQATTGFGRPDETARMTPAVEPPVGDNSFRAPSEEELGSGLRPMEPEDDEARAPIPTEQDPGRGLSSEKDGPAPGRELPTERNSPIEDLGIPSRTTAVPDVGRAADLAIPARPGLEDLVATGRREFEAEKTEEATVPSSRIDPAITTSRPGIESSAARAVDPPVSSDSLDVFAARPIVQAPAAEVASHSMARENEPSESSRAPAETAAPAMQSPLSPDTGSTLLPGRGFFDESPAGDVKDSTLLEPIPTRDVRERASSDDADTRIPVEEPLPARYMESDLAAADDLPLVTFDDENTLDND